MSYTTARGRSVEFPYALAARAVKTGKDEVCALVDACVLIFSELQNADNEVITLREQVKRLTAENNFMVRIMESREELK